MASDSQVVLDVDAPRVMIVREKATSSSSSRLWRTCGVLLAVALCSAAAVCFTMNKTQSEPDESQEIKHALRQISETAKAAIHLSGHYNPLVSNSTVEWFDNADQSFSSGLKLEGNEIKILRKGLYFVYSQASYDLSCQAESEEAEGKMMHLTHTVSRFSEAYNSYKPLLSSTKSACRKTNKIDNTRWYGAIYLGATFNLEAGDRLRTKMDVGQLSKVQSGGEKTFFGAFSL